MQIICAAARTRLPVVDKRVLEIRPLGLDDLVEIRPPKFGDDRGFFSETWNASAWREAGIDLEFVQDNHSLSRQRGVLRGLHYQAPPAAQDKLARNDVFGKIVLTL